MNLLYYDLKPQDQGNVKKGSMAQQEKFYYLLQLTDMTRMVQGAKRKQRER